MSENLEPLELARRAIKHVLETIADSPEKFYLLGDGTESYAKLTAAAAALWGRPVEEVRANFRPDPNSFKRYLGAREADRALLEYCREQGIEVEA